MVKPKPLDLREIEMIKKEVEKVFDRYNYREDIENALKTLGFDLWGYTKKLNGSDNIDEQIWGYNKGTPNGQILILINWIDCFAWVFKKERVINI